MEDRQTNCILCGREVSGGPEKLVIMDSVMCFRCEQLLVKTTVNQKLYLLFKEKIKKIWYA